MTGSDTVHMWGRRGAQGPASPTGSCVHTLKNTHSLPTVSLCLFPPDQFLPPLSLPISLLFLLFLLSSSISLGLFRSLLSLSLPCSSFPLFLPPSCLLTYTTPSQPSPLTCTHIHLLYHIFTVPFLILDTVVSKYHCVQYSNIQAGSQGAAGYYTILVCVRPSMVFAGPWNYLRHISRKISLLFKDT